jgi:hypothetical protein
MDNQQSNAVACFFYYVMNNFSHGEAVKLFGENLGTHIYNKLDGRSIERWFMELDLNCQQTIVNRAYEIYGK